MIVCPHCGVPSEVSETRSVPQGVRRRRQCPKGCPWRITTVEFAAPRLLSRNKAVATNLALVPRKYIRTLQSIAHAITLAADPADTE